MDCDCKANKTTVFFNNNLEHTLHAYIKNNPAVLYEVRFWQQGKKQFVFWRPMPYYDRDKYDGYLFWGNHLVVLGHSEKPVAILALVFSTMHTIWIV